MAGWNSQIDEIQAVVLNAKLPGLDARNARRRGAAARYDALLGDNPRVTRPQVLDGNDHVWHLYAVRVPDRDRVVERLQREGIGAAVHYPIPLHLHGALSDLGHRAGDFPVAEALSASVLSLPLYPQITPSQQEHVVDALSRVLRS